MHPWLELQNDAASESYHVNWLGLSGETDWNLMLRVVAEDFTFVTNIARDFRKLYGRQKLHAGLVVIVPQVLPARQRALFEAVLDEIDDEEPINEAIEVELENGEAVITRYELHASEQ